MADLKIVVLCSVFLLFAMFSCKKTKSEEQLVFADFQKQGTITKRKGHLKKYTYQKKHYYGISVHITGTIDAFECFIIIEDIPENYKEKKQLDFFFGDISKKLTDEDLSVFEHKHRIAGFDNHYFIKNIKWKEDTL